MVKVEKFWFWLKLEMIIFWGRGSIKDGTSRSDMDSTFCYIWITWIWIWTWILSRMLIQNKQLDLGLAFVYSFDLEILCFFFALLMVGTKSLYKLGFKYDYIANIDKAIRNSIFINNWIYEKYKYYKQIHTYIS